MTQWRSQPALLLRLGTDYCSPFGLYLTLSHSNSVFLLSSCVAFASGTQPSDSTRMTLQRAHSNLQPSRRSSLALTPRSCYLDYLENSLLLFIICYNLILTRTKERDQTNKSEGLRNVKA